MPSVLRRFALFSALGWSLLSALSVDLSAAESEPNTSPEASDVVVTGAPIDTSLTSPDFEAAKARLHNLPGATDVVPADELRRGRGAYLEDLLRHEPGVMVQSAQGSEDTRLSIRGSGIQNDDISGISVLVDGVPLNQADGEAFLHDLDLQSIKYAEIYRGSDALRYGAASLGGAVNFVTLTGHDADLFTVRLAFGSFGFAEQQLASGWNDGLRDIYASFSNHVLDGFRDHSQENSQKVFLSLGYRPNEWAENRFYVFYGRLDQNNPSGLTKDQLETDPRQTDPESIAEQWSTRWTYERLIDRFVVKNDEYEFRLALSWNHRQETQRQEFEPDFRLGATRYYSDDFAADLAFQSSADFLHGRNRFSAGIAPLFEPESDSSYANPHGDLGALIATDRTDRLNLPVYFENQHYLTSTISLLTGFQAVYVHERFLDRFQSRSLGDQSHEQTFWAFNPKLGLAYEPSSTSLVYLNFSRSFQPPSFDESLGLQEGFDGGRVFHELQSQKALTIELGTRGESGPFAWDLALYRSWVRDELLDQNNNQGQPLGTINAPKTIHQGIELGLQTTLLRGLLQNHFPLAPGKENKQMVAPPPSDRFILEQTYTLGDFHFDHDPVYGGNRIAGTPFQFYKAEFLYEHPRGFYMGVNLECNLVKYPVDEANTLFADPYALLGVRLGYKTKKGLQIFFEAKNITDKVYAATVQSLGDARFGGDTAAFNPGNGRGFYAGLSWIW